MKTLAVLLLSACVLMGQNNGWYRASIVTQVAAHSADIATSIGGHEQNRLFATADGRFSTPKSIAIKSAWVAGMVAIYSTAWGKRNRRLCTVINFGQAGIVSVVAVRNLGRR
jgi:TctA family transporter